VKAAGFTLLEVMVALGVLAMALMAIADLSGNALRNHDYARQLSQATLLARGKMAGLEEAYEDKGFKDFDESDEGDFADEGHPEFKWRVELKKPEAQLSPEQILGYLTGAAGGDAQDVLAKLMGLGSKDGNGPQPAPVQGVAGAAMSNLLQTQLTAFGEQIKKSLRELRLTVAWLDGRQRRQFTVVTHLVVLNPRAPGGARGDSPDAPPGVSVPQQPSLPQPPQLPKSGG
jgi:general secretion pathway protein I